MNMRFPALSLGDGSAFCGTLPDGKVRVTRYEHEAIVTPATARAAWRQARAEMPTPTTEGDRRDQFRRFCALALGLDLR